MLTVGKAVSAAEVAFMANLSDKEINRMVDEDVLPSALVVRDHGRRFAPLAAPFATFYFRSSEELTRAARVRVIATLTERLLDRPDRDAFLFLRTRVTKAKFDWSVSYSDVTVFLATYVREAAERAARVDQAARHIVEDPEILGGTPCFKGTRVPIANVLAALDAGMSVVELQASYPFLTQALLNDATVYAKARPRVGRPRRIAETLPGAQLVRSKVVRPARENA
ncbi:DUF433 domain-containing protein [Ralstonia pseudosolanacearum]|uniref:DUF433 domain-containing protein n=1 Tax=Ralstonia solanacearum TaxID=305 RepID=A0AA92EBZ4_RALSL|nr:DUF433 domain-containing protein [Ralstonia pseudosolanacearum]QCX48914.1 DUF433 domain-containing protein [Ralstonia pseudosolanacearum]